MLIKDNKVIVSHQQQAVIDRTREQTDKAIAERIANESHMTGMDASMDMTNPEARWGRKLHVDQVMGMLKVLNPNLQFEVSRNLSTLMGMYINEWVLDPNTLGWQYNRRFIMAMENGIMPEFTIVFAEQIELPGSEPGQVARIKSYNAMKRGWRAVLVTLLQQKLITESDIAKYFNIAQGQESANWQKESGNQGTVEGVGESYGERESKSEQPERSEQSEQSTVSTATAVSTGTHTDV